MLFNGNYHLWILLSCHLLYIQEATIHYRCGDNFESYYGFLPFIVFKTLIPANAKLIYVLSDYRGRNTGGRSRLHLESKCDNILKSLFDYLIATFTSATIVFKRGDDVMVDMARIAFSNISICSVGTFCLWPAIACNGTAYYPKTKLILGGRMDLDLGFKWISSPEIVLGEKYSWEDDKVPLFK